MTFTAQHGFDGRNLTVFVPRDLSEVVKDLSDRSAAKHNGYLTITAEQPHRTRTTGERSQNHAIHGYASQLEKWMDDGTSKREIIEEAMARAMIPGRRNRFGRSVFKHESDLSVEEAARIITALKEIADFLGCRLIEGSQEGEGI